MAAILTRGDEFKWIGPTSIRSSGIDKFLNMQIPAPIIEMFPIHMMMDSAHYGHFES